MEFVRAGVAGFILKDATFEEFVQTIRVVIRGEHVLPRATTGTLFFQIATYASRGQPAPMVGAVLSLTD